MCQKCQNSKIRVWSGGDLLLYFMMMNTMLLHYYKQPKTYDVVFLLAAFHNFTLVILWKKYCL